MPPRGRRPNQATDPVGEQQAAADGDQPDQTAPASEPDLCVECFPAGWPEDAYSAGCAHGSYLHHERAAAIRT